MKRYQIILALGVMFVTAISCKQSEEKKLLSQEKSEVSVKEQVKTAVLQMQTIDREVEYPANIKAWEEVHFAPATPGRIEHFYVDVADVVSKGQTLVQMDKSQLLQSELQLKNLETEYKRAKTLYEAGSYAQQAYDQIKTQYEVAKTSYEYLSTNTVLKAPFSGIVSGKYFEDGEMYSGTPVATIGKAAVLSLVEIDMLKAIVSIPESYFPLIKKGVMTNVVADVYPDKKFSGVVNIVYPVIDPNSRTFDVEIKIGNKNNFLRPGMFVRITLHLGKAEAFALPDYAILKTQGSNERYVFVNENGVAKRIVVTLGARYNDLIEVISSDLKPEMEVVVEGQGRLIDGMAIAVVKADTTVSEN
ncbi:MAG: efflux RND transporter periplasmic adaptor subunit [Bacteroidales bacterium]|jgi:RND family efflux transporter MFP subunit|nr:efflux RND transporter periplasmic adaptor subunit [Bacteroidales bacterium]